MFPLTSVLSWINGLYVGGMAVWPSEVVIMRIPHVMCARDKESHWGFAKGLNNHTSKQKSMQAFIQSVHYYCPILTITVSVDEFK